MDDRHFDAWTRRRVGLATGGLLAAALGLGAVKETAAKQKKRCTKAETTCGKKCVKGECCPGKPCGPKGEHCVCEKTIDGKGFCAATKIQLICRQCESHADCEGFETFVPCVKTQDCGPTITASCRLPCGFQP
jgi:hypothetical protein